MQDLSREAILRMVGLHDSAQFMRQINAIQLSLEEQGGQMVAYWTEIRKDERQITLIAGRVSANETSIGQLQVTATSLTASVSSLKTTVDGDGTTAHPGLVSTVSKLSITVGKIDLSVQSLSTTVNGDGTQGSGLVSRVTSLELTDSSISQRVSVIEGDYVKEAEISLMVKKDGNGYISNASIKADNIDFTFTRSTNFISNGTTVMNINSSGDLWVAGEIRGGSITQNVTLGATSSDALYKMVFYTDERISSSLPWLSSGIRGVLNNTIYMNIGFSGVGGTTAYPQIALNNGKTGSNRYYSALNDDKLVFGTSSNNRIIIGYPEDIGKIYIHLNYSDLYKESDLGSIYIGDVYVDNSGYLKIKT